MTDHGSLQPQGASVPTASGSAVTAHYGDPCVYCGVGLEGIAAGSCPSRASNRVGQRVPYIMTRADYERIIGAINVARGTPLIALNCGMPESPQEAANRAWAELGRRLGFDAMTVRPTGQGDLHFSAIAKEVTPPVTGDPNASTAGISALAEMDQASRALGEQA